VSAGYLEIRKPDLAEISELVALDERIFIEDCYNAVVLRQFYDLAGDLFHVACANFALVGYSLALPSAIQGEGWFVTLGVLSSHRRRSIGRSLAQATLHEAKLAGLTTLRVTVARTNSASRNLFNELGFFPEADEEDYFGVGKHRIVMRNDAISHY
jgi:ribosomal protein S18 acetylase RimI-like enzyme